MKFRSLSFKLTAWYTIILAIIITLAGVFLYEQFKDSLMEDLENKLKETAATVYETWWDKKGVTWQDSVNKADEQFKMFQPYIQVIWFPHRKEKDKPLEFFYSSAIRGEQFHLSRDIYYKAKRMDRSDPLYLTVDLDPPATYPLRTILFPGTGHDRRVVIQVGMSLEGTAAEMRRLSIMLILAGPLLLFFASLGGHFIIRRALLPVRSVVQAAREITADDLSLRLHSGGRRDEIGELVDTFNQMIARLDDSVKKIRQFSADVSHELRTPLTIIRGEVEVILRKERGKEKYRQILQSILEETLQLENIIDDLLLMSKLRAVDKQMLMEEFSLDDVLLKVYEDLSPSAGREKIQVKLKEITPVRFTGKRTLIERMITNIIDNAVRYTPSGGEIEISLTHGEGGVELTVSDTGIGIPSDALPFIFDRFYVVEKSRSKEAGGTGLGLSIVKLIAENHGIEVNVQSELNKGTTFRFLFP